MACRIAFVTEYCPPYRTGFYERFDERFNSHVFFCATKESWRAFGQFDYSELTSVQLRDRYRVAPSLWVRLIRYDPDVVIGGPVEGYAGQAAYLYAKATRKPFVLWTGAWHLPHTTLRTVSFPLVKRAYLGADAVAVYGPHIRDYVTDLGVDPDVVEIAWNTVDLDRFSTANEERIQSLQREYNINPSDDVILYVGRLVKEKGIDYLLEGYKHVRSQLSNRTHLLIVGDGDRRKQLEASAHGIEDVHFTGYVENTDLPNYYHLSTVFVLPSITTDIFREPWGLVVNEAMSAGLPILTSSSVGAANGGLVEYGENGYIVPERNPTAIADRLEAILEAHDPEVMGAKSQRIISDFTFDRMVDGFEAAIDQALYH